MSIKGQLNSSRDFLMAGMRAAARGSTPNEQAGKLLRACLDLVEHLERQSENVTAAEVETTLGVMTRAAAELEQDEGASAVLAAMRNAIGRMQSLRTEITQPK
jgi:hypothetical protein